MGPGRPQPLMDRRAAMKSNVASTGHRVNKGNAALWTVQALLALLFLFGGLTKLVMPIEALTAQVALPGPFLRFVGAAETLGAIGLILPGLLRIATWLTPLAAAGLLIIMTGATLISLPLGAAALFPFIVG